MPGPALVVGVVPGVVVVASAPPSEQAAVPKTTTARPAFPISAIAMRRLIRRWVVIGLPIGDPKVPGICGCVTSRHGYQDHLAGDRASHALVQHRPDLPVPPPPVLHPGTHGPVGPDDLAPLFPMDLILQEVSSERFIEIPEEMREYRCGARPRYLLATTWRS